MKRIFFDCSSADEDYFDTAPARLRAHFDVPKPAATVWDELTSDSALRWCRILHEVTWTSPRPFGVGTTREVSSLFGANIIREHYFRWEEGRRHSFYVVEASAPIFRRLAEDYLVEPTGEESCRFSWTIAFELQPLALPTMPVNKAILKTLFTDTRRHYGLG